MPARGGMVDKSAVASGTCMGESLSGPLGADHSAGPWWRTGPVGYKEALHIQITSSEECFNRDGGLEVRGCWNAVMRRQGRGEILTDL